MRRFVYLTRRLSPSPYFILDGISEAIDNMTMTDKELGKLWADTNYMEIGYSGLVAIP
jgi:hypothetical protein